MNDNKVWGMEIISAKITAYSFSFSFSRSDRAVAFLYDGAAHAHCYPETCERRANPNDREIVGTASIKRCVWTDAPKDDAAFKRWFDTGCRKPNLWDGGKTIPEWFLVAITAENLNLNLPVSDDIKALFRASNDTPFSRIVSDSKAVGSPKRTAGARLYRRFRRRVLCSVREILAAARSTGPARFLLNSPSIMVFFKVRRAASCFSSSAVFFRLARRRRELLTYL